MLLTEFDLMLNCGLKLGVNPSFTRVRMEKNLARLENGFIFEKSRDPFEPCIEQKQKGDDRKYYPSNSTTSDPKCAIPIKENQRNKPECSKYHQNGINHSISHHPKPLSFKPYFSTIHLCDFARKPVSKYATNHGK